MKKALLIIILVSSLLLLPACTTEIKNSVSIPEWTLTVETAGEWQFNSVDAAAYPQVTIEATTKNKDGESSTGTYTGIRLTDILKDVSDFSNVTVVAADGFSADYDKQLAMAEDTILAWEKDGKPIDTDPPLQMAPKQGTGNQFVKSVAKIVVNP